MIEIPGYDGRPARVEDAEMLLPMYEASDLAAVGTVDITLADVDGLLRDPRARLDVSLLLPRDGVPAGLMVPSVRTTDKEGTTPIELEIVADPDHQVVFEALVAAGVAAVRELAGSDGDRHRVDVWALEPVLQEVLSRAGFGLTSRHVRLQRDFRGDEQAPPSRDDVRVRLVDGEGDRRTFHATLVEVFADSDEGGAIDPYDLWSERMESADVHDPGQWWLLERRSGEDWQSVGLVQGSRQAEADNLGWIKNYGLVPSARGSGLGRYLLEWAVAEFAGRGHKGVGLGADLGNTTGALKVYELAGFRQLYTAERYSALASAVSRS